MKRMEIQVSITEINDLITLLNSDPKFENIRKQVIRFKEQSQHDQSDEIPIEGDHEYIERSE